MKTRQQDQRRQRLDCQDLQRRQACDFLFGIGDRLEFNDCYKSMSYLIVIVCLVLLSPSCTKLFRARDRVRLADQRLIMLEGHCRSQTSSRGELSVCGLKVLFVIEDARRLCRRRLHTEQRIAGRVGLSRRSETGGEAPGRGGSR